MPEKDGLTDGDGETEAEIDLELETEFDLEMVEEAEALGARWCVPSSLSASPPRTSVVSSCIFSAPPFFFFRFT